MVARLYLYTTLSFFLKSLVPSTVCGNKCLESSYLIGKAVWCTWTEEQIARDLFWALPLTVQPWAGYLTSLYLRFFSGDTVIPTW